MLTLWNDKSRGYITWVLPQMTFIYMKVCLSSEPPNDKDIICIVIPDCSVCSIFSGFNYQYIYIGRILNHKGFLNLDLGSNYQYYKDSES